MTTPRLPVRIENHVARITFNNPEKHNAVSMDMWQGLVDALKAFATDPAVRVLVRGRAHTITPECVPSRVAQGLAGTSKSRRPQLIRW